MCAPPRPAAVILVILVGDFSWQAGMNSVSSNDGAGAVICRARMGREPCSTFQHFARSLPRRRQRTPGCRSLSASVSCRPSVWSSPRSDCSPWPADQGEAHEWPPRGAAAASQATTAIAGPVGNGLQGLEDTLNDERVQVHHPTLPRRVLHTCSCRRANLAGWMDVDGPGRSAQRWCRSAPKSLVLQPSDRQLTKSAVLFRSHLAPKGFFGAKSY